MFLKNVSILYGKNLECTTTDLKIANQVFTKIGKGLQKEKDTIDCEGLLLVPGFVNAHTHIGDSIAKDAVLKGSVNSKIHPVLGAKTRILRQTAPQYLAAFMKNACLSMIKKGITTFVDFREGGLDGVLLLKKSISKLPIRPVILGRLEYYQDKDHIKKNLPLDSSQKIKLQQILKVCDGLGISGSNENSDAVLNYYSKTGKLRVIHCSETEKSIQMGKKITGKSETTRSLLLKPHFLVHMTYASKTDLRNAAKKTKGIVVCPRANASLAEGIPDISLMIENGCRVAIGTDNVMVNSPDMFREMDYLWKVSMGIHKKRIDPKEILKMATVNGGMLLGKKIGSIEQGYIADAIFVNKHAIDLEPMHNPHAALVHRASESTIKAVMIGGKIVHGKL